MEFVHKREKERSKNALRRVYGGNKTVVYGGGGSHLPAIQMLQKV